MVNKEINSLKDEKNKKGIIPIDIVSEMEESYISYAMSVITTRALPDVRDGLKPVHRRILYSMSEMGLTASARPRKSAAVIGDVLGKYHPHGDTSVYDAMVGMAQDFSYRYPLVIGQGNFGSVDGDPPAAMRYTEAKMSKLSSELLKDLEKNTVNLRPNYDNTRKEPTVLPSTVPNLLLNGTLGIAVGMATNIPPHNLDEVIDACIHLIENNKDTTNEDLTNFIKGPDFPTGGIVYGGKDIHHIYASGRGGIICRGESEIIENKSGTFQIVINSLPYRVNKADLIIKIADLIRNKKIEGIKDLRDESTKETRIVIDLKNGVQPQKIINYIYKHTSLETAFHFNMVALVDGVPQTLSLKSLLEEFISHREDVVKRRTAYDLKKAEEREHILLGLKRALDHIDKVIKIIKSSKDTISAKINLIKEFKFSEPQAIAILEMKLQKLAGLERKNIEIELKEKQSLIEDLKSLLASSGKIFKVITEELIEIKSKYGDERRTKIIKGDLKNISDEDLIPEKESVLVLTADGYVKRTDPIEYKTQKRGGVGVVDLSTKEEDFVNIFLRTSTHSDLLFFTNLGKVYQIKMYDLREDRRATKGKSIMNYLPLVDDEKVTSVLPISEKTKQTGESFILVTKKGTAKKVTASDFRDVRRSGLIAIKLNKGDQLIEVLPTTKGDEIVLATSVGQSIRFKESDIRKMGRTASGVRAVKLTGNDYVVGVSVIEKEYKQSELLTMSANGFGKKTSLNEYKVQKRGGSGIKTAKINLKTGKLIIAKVIKEGSELIAISQKGQVIRVKLESVPSLGRQTQGVKIMKLRANDKIASLTLI